MVKKQYRINICNNH